MLTILKRSQIIITILATTYAFNVAAEQSHCDQTKNITFINYDIFDLTDQDTIFLHNWANFFHIKKPC